MSEDFFILVLLLSIKSINCIDCDLIFPLSQLPNNCTSMTGDIVIDGKNATTLLENHFQFPILQQKFMKIENWTGSIKIIYTDFQNLSFFKSLASVKTDFPGSSFVFFLDEDDIHNEMRYATFWIESNPNITSLGIPSLKQVTADVLPTIRTVYGFYLKNNAELCLSDSEFWMLRKMERSLLFGMKICGAVTKQYCYQNHFDHNNIPLGCQILLTGIWLNEIKNTSVQSYLNQAFATVEEVHGPIVIFNTDFTNLSYPLLHTIRNQFYDGQNDWQRQILNIRGNEFLTSLEFPKLTNWSHYGNEEQLINSGNKIWNYSEPNCNLFRRIPFFSIKDPLSNCGLVPIINDGARTMRVIIQIAEKIASLAINFVFCMFLCFKLFKCKITTSFYHLAMIAYIFLTILECLFVNLDFVFIFNDNNFAIPVGLRSIFLYRDQKLFNLISNVMYTNRLVLLISCTLYRPMHIMRFGNWKKFALGSSVVVFFVANISNIFVMEFEKYKLTFAMFPLSVLLFLFSFISNACVCGAMSQLPEPFKNERTPQNLTSLSLFLQALFILIVGLFSEGLNHMFSSSPALVQQIRDFDYFFYFWGSIIMRWHYAIILLIQTFVLWLCTSFNTVFLIFRAFISHTFVMFSVDDIPTPKPVSP
ncbi:hypothetical protein CRE_00501 [Caenorhabditis remanei]|uniref:Receptor L-domain domain-containing protein n=1 Tax=Caenorhabditis remanei TaxID=31234 RepID=E3LCC8_CAERE|nr:hypothetical protein CRE_00501 [Caenorhabditis remanei]